MDSHTLFIKKSICSHIMDNRFILDVHVIRSKIVIIQLYRKDLK
jgi:hypothetical protein